jgi:hypothetical protein
MLPFKDTSMLKQWLKTYEKKFAIWGIVIVLATYVAKDVLQSRLEEKIREIDTFLMENRLTNELRALEPDLRTELSRGSDAKKRFNDQDQSLLVNRRKDGSHLLPFGSLVDAIECKDDQACRTAEWLRYHQQLKNSISTNDRLAEIVGEPELDQTNAESKRLERLSEEGLKKLEAGPIAPSRDDVDEYVGHVSSLGSALDATRDALVLYAGDVISTKHWELAAISLLSGVLYVTGWFLTLVGRIYGVDVGAAGG